MDMTQSAAELRLAPLKRSGVVKSLRVTTERLTVRVVQLNEETVRQVRAAISDTHWPLNIVEAQAEPADDGLTQSGRFMQAARDLECDDDPERFAERVKKLAKRASVEEVIQTPKGKR